MALLVDIVVYGVPVALGLGALKLFHGKYYGRKPPPPKPDEGTQPKDE